MPEGVRHGAFTSNEEMLSTIQTMAVTVGVINAKLDSVISENQDRKAENEQMKQEINDVKAKVYTMSGVIGIITAAVTSFVADRFSGG